MKIKVVGAGLSGLWVSYTLLKRGHEVEVYEKNYPGYGASSKAAGILSLELPKEMIDVSIRSSQLYAELGKEIIKWSGSIWIPKDSELKCVINIGKYLSTKGIDVKIIPNGFNSIRICNKAILFEQPIVDAGEAINELVRRIEKMGGNIVEEEVKKQEISNGKGTFVLANGPWARELVELEGLVNYRCQAHSIEGKQINEIIENDRTNYYYVPESPRRAILGNGDKVLIKVIDDGFVVDYSDAYNVLEKVSKNYGEAKNMYPVNSWAAPCVTTFDGYPIVGKLRENLYIITGLNGAGLTLSPGLAEILADVIEGKYETPKYLDPWRPMKRKEPLLEVFDNICH
ncbi:MAG: FAD-binding oxidoreductase [Caldisphaeraceae archaeon]|nr:FAD-binding oxidoreductase [Caldisphaeraceae archaeon]MEB3691942.1 FAD-binding oxidoreductase [Caldisphaeraceae archaeon]MEB3798452.1 FAD-binding oxidoreductase [Caldisphaeraceae archaeon]